MPTRPRIWGPALLVFLSARAAWDAEPAPDPPFHSTDFPGSASCQSCHPRQYNEWRGSAHAYALADPIFVACGRHAQETTAGAIGEHCIRCHGPVGARSGELPTVYDTESLSPVVKEAVSCEVCHRMEAPPPGLPLGDAEFGLGPGKAFYARLHEPLATDAHENARGDYVARSESCGSCHEVLFGSMTVEGAFSEWRRSPFAERGVSCQDCHMQRYSGRAAVGGPFREILRRHNFPGVTLPPPGFPNLGLQAEEVDAFLRTALRVSVVCPPSAASGSPLSVTVHLKNSGTGHNFPSASFRRLWLEVTAVDSKGRTLYRSGHLDERGDVLDAQGLVESGTEDRPTAFRDAFVDRHGREVPYWFASRVVQRTLASLEERNVPYSIPVPSDLEGGSLRVGVRVLFRAYEPRALERIGLDPKVHSPPVWELHRFDSEAITVCREPIPPPIVYVPRDAPSIQTAIDHATDGQRIVVAPGEYAIEAPIDFRGRAVSLVSLQGPERTTIAWAQSVPLEARGSVVVFHGGEGRDTRLEGFTLRGGRGSLADGVRRGGGIHIRGAAPTIEANAIVDCSAPDGLGGGIASEDGAPALRRNSIIECWARLGGGLAFRGEGDPVCEALFVEGCMAEKGAGLYVDEGTELLAKRAVFAGNHATTEGPAAFVAAGASLRLEHATLVRNSSNGQLGLVVAGAQGRASILNSVFWENTPDTIGIPATACLVPEGTRGVEDARYGFPLFTDPMGNWIPNSAPERREGPPRALWPRDWNGPRLWHRGDWSILPGSPAADASPEDSPPDPDDSRADLGAFFLEVPLRAFERGDVDGSGQVDPEDLGRLAAALLGTASIDCLDAADLDDDGRVGILDALILGAYLRGIPSARPPAPPFPHCGHDPTFGEGLSCEKGSEPCRR